MNKVAAEKNEPCTINISRDWSHPLSGPQENQVVFMPCGRPALSGELGELWSLCKWALLPSCMSHGVFFLFESYLLTFFSISIPFSPDLFAVPLPLNPSSLPLYVCCKLLGVWTNNRCQLYWKIHRHIPDCHSPLCEYKNSLCTY